MTGSLGCTQYVTTSNSIHTPSSTISPCREVRSTRPDHKIRILLYGFRITDYGLSSSRTISRPLPRGDKRSPSANRRGLCGYFLVTASWKLAAECWVSGFRWVCNIILPSNSSTCYLSRVLGFFWFLVSGLLGSALR